MGTIQISRHLHLLQDHAGAALFEKDGTGLRLTPAGTAFHASVRTALDELESAYRRLVSDAQAPGLHVACSVTFAMRWLVPQLAVFYRQHPDIRIRLSMTSAREMRDEGADLILAWDLSGYTEADQRQAIVLAPVRFGAVCTPDYARKQPADRVPAMNTPPVPGTSGRQLPVSRPRKVRRWRFRIRTCASKPLCQGWAWHWSSSA
ncbi:LysR family transcriptional regulator [Pseudomonas sp. Marseille-Q8238]